MNKRHLYFLALGLSVCGIGMFLYKAMVLEFPLLPQAHTDLWDVEIHLSFHAKDQPVKASVELPTNTSRFAIIDESFISQGYGLTTVKDGAGRKGTWSKRKAGGKQNLYYRGTVHRVQLEESLPKAKLPEIFPAPLEGAELEAAKSLLNEIRTKSADVPTLVTELIQHLNQSPLDPNLQLLLHTDHSLGNKLKQATHVLALTGVLARVVNGIKLENSHGPAQIVHWLQIYEDEIWKSYDPITGLQKIPSDYFPWWKDYLPLVEIEGGDRLSVTLTVAPNQQEAIRAAILHSQLASPHLLEFSLFSLPLETQAVYRILLMVPIGALLLLILRNIVGVKTFGTFMPILMALAFRETQLAWGIVLFSVIVALGLGVRFYLEHLRLLLVPRLASVLIIVVLLMAMLSVLSQKLGLDRGLSIALFPMVILTMTIERMCVVWEERGASESIQQGLGSLAVASMTYLAMTIPYMEHLLFVFPELLLICLAGTLLMGRYTGFRLLELGRFKALTHSPAR